MISERSYGPAELPDLDTREPQTVPAEVPVAWSAGKRLLFRFVCAYFFLYIFPFPLYYLPFLERPLQAYQDLWTALVSWVGSHVFQVQITVQPNGSGDTTYSYMQMFCMVMLAALAALVWTLVDRRRAHYTRLEEWLRVYVRFSLAAAMVTYGGFKIIPSQFPAPTLDRLLQPFGDASPMGLLWTFMGASKPYEIFSGAAEMLAGLLLIARRTAMLGALVAIAVLANIVMLNFCYDVPVKLYSSHLLLMAIFLALPDLRRLADFFVFNRPVQPRVHARLFRRPWLHRGALAFRTVLILGIAGYIMYGAYQTQSVPKSQLRGIWNVEDFVVDGQARPPLVTDESRWWRVVFDDPAPSRSIFAIQRMDQSRQRFDLKMDPKKRTLELAKRDDPKWKSTLSYQQLGPDLLALEGTVDGQRVRAQVRRMKDSQFRLIDRGFHWINEYPFNK